MNSGQQTPPRKISSHTLANDFFYWLAENIQVTNIQGWEIERLQDGRPSLLAGAGMELIFDIETIYNRRKEINDWIDNHIIQL